MSHALRRVAALAVAVLLAGCVGALRDPPLDKQRFLIELARPASGETPAANRLRIDRLRVNSLFDRKGFTYRTGEHTFDNDFYSEFFAPPGTVVQTALITWLRSGGRFAEVGASETLEPDWIVDGNVVQLFVDLRDRAAPRAIVALELRLVDARAPGMPAVFASRYADEEAPADLSGQAIIEAWSRALARIAERFEADVEAARARGPAARR